jgi:uncharacterized repeat protein (TIGR01451 family)
MPQGASNDDPAATEGYFVGVDGTTAGRLVLRRVLDPGGAPSVSANLNLTVPTTRAPIGVVARTDVPPAPPALDALDDRLFAAHVRRNKLTGVTSLWTAHNIEVDATGVAAAGGRNGSRWYEVGTLTGTPALLQAGTLFDDAATDPRSFWIPTVNMSGQGHMALGASYASVNDYAGVAVAGRFAGDPAGATAAPSIAQAGLFPYDDILGSLNGTNQRWGAYSQTVIDPDDDMTFWTFQEYSEAADVAGWGVRVTELVAPPPATLASASSPTVAQGQAAVLVTVSGTSTSGSGFFDPGPDTGGPGFANRITAAVSGGVGVNSVAVTSPTQLSLSLNTTVAALGPATVTVTNPDGQSVSGAILEVVPAVAVLSATKTVSGTFLPTGLVTYTIVLTNTGTGPQPDNAGDELTDVLPASLVLVSANASSGTAVATPGTNTVTWNGALAVSATVTLTIQATVGPAVPGGTQVSNQGSIGYDSDGNGTNDALAMTDDPAVGGASDPTVFTVSVLPGAVLSATKAASGTFVATSLVTYAITLTNTGTGPQSDNPGDELTDVLPASLVLVSANASSGTATATPGTNTVTWNGAVAVSATVTLTIQATVAPAVPGGTVISNQGSIAYDSDGNGANDAVAMTDDASVGGASDPTVFTVRGAYFTLTPCRVVDTRNPTDPFGGPALVAGASRTFALAGNCGIPAAARALSLNVTVTAPSGAGDLRIYPAGLSAPLVSTINWSPGQTRANNAIAVLSPGGLEVLCDQASGSVHLIVDVNGYFQ